VSTSCLFISAFVLLISLARPSYACSCAFRAQSCEEYNRSAVVFVGTVIGARTVETEDPLRFRFSVDEVYKGETVRELEIATGMGGGDCGWPFERGKRYVVYPYEHAGTLATNICTRTARLESADQDLAFLRGLASADPGATLSGTVINVEMRLDRGFAQANRIGPMADVPVVIEGAGARFETMADSQGRFHKSGLAPGKYRVSAVLPAEFRLVEESSKPEIVLTSRGCVATYLRATVGGAITGVLRQNDGMAAPRLPVHLKAVDNDNWISAKSDARGAYEFPAVPPGRYLLGVNIAGRPLANAPFPPTYYPGRSDRKDAVVIEVASGTRAAGYDVTLPHRIVNRTLRGQVVWPDGKPVGGATVQLDCCDASDFFLGFDTDDQGYFSLNVFEGYRYRLSAENSVGFSAPLEVGPEGSLANIRLVLDQDKRLNRVPKRN
jgi:hypothetical protein